MHKKFNLSIGFSLPFQISNQISARVFYVHMNLDDGKQIL